MKKIVLAFDSFKGCMSSSEAARAAANGIAKVRPDLPVEIIVAADGGEGMSEAVLLNGIGEQRECGCHDPLMRPIQTSYTIDYESKRAYIDLAATAGLTLLSPQERNPLLTTTYGTGEMILDAIAAGAREIFLGLGGSSTNDAALGALGALGAKFFDENGKFLPPNITGSDLERISKIEFDKAAAKLEGVTLRLLCDVTNPFVGVSGAVNIYAAQKGADRAAMVCLEEGMKNVAKVAKKCGFIDVFSLPGSGAAGGAGGGLASIAGCDILPGARTLLELADFERHLSECSLLLTGEGKSDLQTLCNKLPFTAMTIARKHRVPTILLSGIIENERELMKAGFAAARSINSSMKSELSYPDSEEENPLLPAVAKRRMETATAFVVTEFFDEIGNFRN